MMYLTVRNVYFGYDDVLSWKISIFLIYKYFGGEDLRLCYSC